VPRPDFQTIMLPLLEMFKNGETKTTTQMYAELADCFGLTELERTERLPSGHQTRFHNRVGWARTHLKKAGLLERIGSGLGGRLRDDLNQANIGRDETKSSHFIHA
jgi:restriction system protein